MDIKYKYPDTSIDIHLQDTIIYPDCDLNFVNKSEIDKNSCGLYGPFWPESCDQSVTL